MADKSTLVYIKESSDGLHVVPAGEAIADLVTTLKQARQFVAKYTADHDSVIGERMLRKIDTAIEKAKGEVQP